MVKINEKPAFTRDYPPPEVFSLFSPNNNTCYRHSGSFNVGMKHEKYLNFVYFYFFISKTASDFYNKLPPPQAKSILRLSKTEK